MQPIIGPAGETLPPEDDDGDILHLLSDNWKFFLCVSYIERNFDTQPVILLENEDGTMPSTEGYVEGVEDILWMRTEKNMGSVPTMPGYQVCFEQDLSHPDDAYATYIAYRIGPNPIFSTVKLVFAESGCEEQLDNFIMENSAGTKKNAKPGVGVKGIKDRGGIGVLNANFKGAPNEVCNNFGGNGRNVGLLVIAAKEALVRNVLNSPEMSPSPSNRKDISSSVVSPDGSVGTHSRSGVSGKVLALDENGEPVEGADGWGGEDEDFMYEDEEAMAEAARQGAVDFSFSFDFVYAHRQSIPLCSSSSQSYFFLVIYSMNFTNF